MMTKCYEEKRTGPLFKLFQTVNIFGRSIFHLVSDDVIMIVEYKMPTSKAIHKNNPEASCAHATSASGKHFEIQLQAGK